MADEAVESGTGMAEITEAQRALLEAVTNLSSFHHDHERFYASSPREVAVTLQRHARTLQGLADRWSTTAVQDRTVLSPYEGCEDLNEASAMQLDGVLFLEGEGRPTELDAMVRSLRAVGDDFAGTGRWLATAMESSWAVAASLVELDGLADVLGERHRIIANDWQAASMSSLVGVIAARAADMLDAMDLTPAAVRRDLAGDRVLAARLYAVGELIDHAADLCSDSAGLVHDNERRWRIFRTGVAGLLARAGESVPGGPSAASGGGAGQ
jgi:hypothetical protein